MTTDTQNTIARIAIILSLAGATLVQAAKTENKPCPPKDSTKVSDIVFVAYDTETTGFSPYKNRILEIGAVKFLNGEVLEEKSWLINPEQRIAYWAREAHGISNEELASCALFPEVYAEFAEFTKGCVLFAHNARFDVGFIREEIERNKLDVAQEPTLDSMRLFRTWWPDLPSHTIGNLTEALKINTDVFHRALADTLYIVYIFNEGMKDKPADYSYGQLKEESTGELFFIKE
ncbi:MAG: 3'-5' exonuclease [Kiritimatiellae bacterium]|nr:3'-5' exonuclease [Kiritimatiellia bacterium]